MQVSTALQEEILDEIVNNKIPVTMFLMNGFQYRGVVVDHDDAVVVIETEGKHQMVYKHAISTVSPGRMLNVLKD